MSDPVPAQAAAEQLAAEISAALDHAYIDGHCDRSPYAALDALAALAARVQEMEAEREADLPSNAWLTKAADAIRAAEARVEAAEQEREWVGEINNALNEAHTALAARVQQLEQALAAFGCHDERCASHHSVPSDPFHLLPCDCGLAAALAACGEGDATDA